MDDPRLTPARPDLAAKYLEGKVKAARFVDGEEFCVREAIAPRICTALEHPVLMAEDDGTGADGM